MTRIILDDQLLEKLGGVLTNLEICDAQGHILARVEVATPDTDPDQWEWITPEVSDEEIARRLASNEPRYSTAQVIEILRGL